MRVVIASTALDVSMRFSDGVPVAPYCFICRRRGATRARATDLLAVRGSQRGVLKPLQVSPSCSRCRLGSAREGKLNNQAPDTCSVGNAAAVFDTRLLLVSYMPLARFC